MMRRLGVTLAALLAWASPALCDRLDVLIEERARTDYGDALPDTGVPATALMRRPDVRQQFYSLAAADRRVAVAVADRYPQLSLSASLSASIRRMECSTPPAGRVRRSETREAPTSFLSPALP